jgi:hypothetical protein
MIAGKHDRALAPSIILLIFLSLSTTGSIFVELWCVLFQLSCTTD